MVGVMVRHVVALFVHLERRGGRRAGGLIADRVGLLETGQWRRGGGLRVKGDVWEGVEIFRG